MTSLGAANKCVDNSLDFVYIDTNNEFTQTTSDIHEWVKKVRPGGIIAGHDYYHYRPRALIHMYQAVNSYASAYKIAPWFVVGRDVDRVRSWFWIKA
jgi:predicted O-methyltransferase YrrM